MEFTSAASASAVCSYCRSTLLREGEALRRIGESAELFDDHSPLQLGAAGVYQGVPFTLVGRLQYRYPEGTWNEWHALFVRPDGRARPAWLSEDNGAYVLSFDLPSPTELPPRETLLPGNRLAVAGAVWSVASVQQAALLAAQGELPRPPRPPGPDGAPDSFVVIDLRNASGEVGTLDWSDPAAPQWSVGRSVTLADLKMQGLREASQATLAGQALSCPSCGAALAPKLASTRSLTCGQCRAVVDLSRLGGPGQDVSADLAHYAQNNSGAGGLEPQIPLGRVGRLALGAEGPLDWQVVGYQERCDLPGPGDDEQTFWREYLLYHRTAGFAFLVDADDGWSWVRPLTGAPVARGSGATWAGLSFTERYSYDAKVTWVLGEFYWNVKREERARVTDYEGPRGARLSREQTGREVVWSLGKALKSSEVAQAFRLPPEQAAALRRDAGPLSADVAARGIRLGVVILIIAVLMAVVLSRCTSDRDCEPQRTTFGEGSPEYQECLRNTRHGGFSSGGGSFGGYSSGGGGHK